MAAKPDAPIPGPWRDTTLQWTDEEYTQKRQAICSRAPQLGEADTYNILLCGVVGAGKSSFINTIYSAIRNKIGQIAFTRKDTVSVTTKFRVYRFRENIGDRAIPITICDTMGVEYTETSRRGLSERDIENILDGHIRDGYEFKANQSINYKSPYYNPSPEQQSKIHVVVVVIDAQPMEKELSEKLEGITKLATEKDIRYVIVLTKIDQISEDVKNDLTLVHNCKAVEDMVGQVREYFGVNESSIFPIQNYSWELQPTVPINVLALHTLEHILNFADMTLESQRGILPQDEFAPEMEHPLPDTTWRSQDRLSEEGVQTMWTELVSIEPTRVPKFRVCLMGPSGGGKSAFINSAMSEMYQRIVSVAATSCVSRPTTNMYKEYIFKQGRDGRELDIILCDTMGVLPSGGLKLDDVSTVLDGKVSADSRFCTSSLLPKSDSTVPLSNQPHVLALVLSGAEIDSYSQEVIEKMQSILTTAAHPGRELERIVLVTHVDQVCGHVADDPTNVFRSQKVKNCLEKVKKKLDVPLPDIWPVVNFADDTEVDWRKSALILQALLKLLERAQDQVSKKEPVRRKGWFW